ncbi:MAG: M48 family metalloprotease [Armatimonadetes bacterium]|nr:M48 family metalloprotease [Armatimonadota bacterium]
MSNLMDHDESRRRFLRQAALAGAGLAAAPLLLTPQVAEAGGLFNFMVSPGDQKKVGDQAAQQVLQQYHEIHDGRARHFNELGQRLVAALPDSDRKTWDFRFHVLDSKEINAFALPGGNMFMFTGLYEKVPTEDALAAVTGHEMTHVRKQHWAKANAQQQQRDLGLSALLMIFKAPRAVQTIASLADSAISLKYSRGEEDQADQGGLDNMVAAGYNPEGMIQLFQVLQKVSGNGGSLGGDFLSDHPLTSDRIKHAQQRIAALHVNHPFPPLTPLNYNALIG